MRVVILAALLLGMTTVQGQDLILQYFDRNGNAVDKEKSHFYMVGKQALFLETSRGRLDTVASYVDTVDSYYTASDVLRSREVYNADGVLHGLYLTYYENGIPSAKTTFFNGRPVGFFMTWYTTGKPHGVKQYHKDAGYYSKWPENDFKIVNYWDSKGKKLVDNGEGFCDCYFNEGIFHEKGRVKNGIRDSVWSGYSGDTLLFREQYANGLLVKGERFYKNNTQDYYSFETRPEYRSGANGMLAFIQRNLVYPPEARQKGVEGSVFVQFIVERDGTLTEVEVVQGIDGLNEEALRVVKLMPPWSPGLQRGEAVRAQFVLPVKFVK